MPYKELKIGCYIIRLFYKKDEMLYKWHSDENNRSVYFYPFGKWLFQYNECLPKHIKIDDWRFIYRGDPHRIIRKSGILLAIVKQY